LKKSIEQTPEVSVLILDPMNSYWGEADDNKSKEITPVLESVAALCRETGLTVIGLIHHSKRSDTDALGKVLGSVRVGGIARCVWEISRSTEDPKIIRMALVKGNLSRKRSGMTYHIESTVLTIEGETEEVAKIVWDAELDKSADELLDEQRKSAKEGSKDRKLELAKALLHSNLPMTPPELFKLGAAEQISVGTIYRAKEELCVFSERLNDRARRWWLPEQWAEEVKKSDSVLIPDTGAM